MLFKYTLQDWLEQFGEQYIALPYPTPNQYAVSILIQFSVIVGFLVDVINKFGVLILNSLALCYQGDYIESVVKMNEYHNYHSDII